MALLPDFGTGSPHEDISDRRSRIAGGILSAGTHLVIALALLLTGWQTVPKTFSPTITVSLMPAPAKPPPPAIRPRLIVPQSIDATLPHFDIAVAPEPAATNAATTSTSVSPPPSVKGPPSPGTALNDDLGPYYAKIIKYMQARLRTPSRGGRQGRELTATIHVISDRKGHVLLVELFESSGYDDLDEEAVGVVKRSDPLPPIPPDIRADQININIPVVFNFQQDSILVR